MVPAAAVVIPLHLYKKQGIHAKIFQNIEAASPKPYPIFSFSEILFVIDLFLVCNRNVAQNNLLFFIAFWI